jgi:adenylyltransferase/sulfurtransferase
MFPILPGEGPCLRCVFEGKPPAGVSLSCDTAGVIGPIVAIIAAMQVGEALKMLSGARDRVCRKITSVDLWENQHHSVNLPPIRSDCPCCVRHEFPFLEGLFGAEAATLCGRNSVQIRRNEASRMNLDAIAGRLEPICRLEQNRFLVRATIDGYQLTVFSDGRAIINGTYDIGVAKSLYARYIGN